LIATRILGAGAFSLIVLTIALLVCARETVSGAMYGQITERVQSAEKTLWYLVNERGAPTIDAAGDLRFGSWVVRGDHAVVDRTKELTGADATIFQVRDGVPVRVTTTVRKPNSDERNDNTELTGAARAAFDAGRSFTGVSPVAGRPFINRYEPITDSSGHTIGIIYTGEPLAAMNAAVNRTMEALLIAALIGLVVLLGLLFGAVRPVRRNATAVTHAARRLADGDVDQTVAVHSNDELGDIATAFRDMLGYQQRMTRVADAIADGDLSSDVQPVSDRDRFAHAFLRMVATLRELIAGMTELRPNSPMLACRARWRAASRPSRSISSAPRSER
jgi:HAMP domain-containing protein